ncbi:probable LRR receptor-like serine/threonine-protein kinase At1g56140 [Nymphaea colorata]|nr:probable LRR receptor-like serine/threonine-protein kinase At1g56140 [Nymphaea colorata]
MEVFNFGWSLRILFLLTFHGFVCFVLVGKGVQAQATTSTDPADASAFRSISRQWSLQSSASWNLTEPCTGTAVDSTDIESGLGNYAIKCNCSVNNGTICRITKLKVFGESVNSSIPEALWNLTALSYLNLGQNMLTGTLSPSIGNLTSMQSLRLGPNSFSGSLPSELGNLLNLQELYIDSAGVSGPIPSTFIKLQNMQTLWAFDNQFTGKIPDFIGKWTKLTTLRLQGNSFEGPIPSSFSNLTSMADLRISELSNGSSSLSFIKNMKSLKTLVLRNNMMSGTFPADIWDLQNLRILDLSFNSFTGQLPSSLFSMSSLSHLFLGNNLLSGSVPSQKSSSLLNIDLSYNNMTGSLPSWFNQTNLQVNLVGNSFSSNISGLPSGLYCLQKSFPCHINPPYSSFAVNCGGLDIKSGTLGTLFERDNASLNASSYFTTETKKWAVSSNGVFIDIDNPQYILNSQSQFTNTLDSELFQTARASPGSLRYYGLGLENGNYTVQLEFAETTIQGSVGRRLFDIHIQGNLAKKDFDITKQAGGTYLRSVSLNYTANVSQNFLEIHFFWAGKGTCCIPVAGTYGPTVSAISVTPDFIPESSPSSNPPPQKSRTGLVVGTVAAVIVAIGITVIISVLFLKQRKKKLLLASADEELLVTGARPNTFSYAELKTATEDFNPANKLGQGGFGTVYKGSLADGKVVAVKRLSAASQQGRSQFLTEIAAISAVQHRNLVKLYGCCLEGDQRLLVYEYLENKSLDQALFGKSGLNLDWPTRYEICLGTAQGLAYLHEESRIRIVHRDVKASNILLDAELSPKISDFGLAKLYDDKKTHISTRVAGTIGYLAPEYAMRGHLTEKADVFGFGVVMLEILSGRPNADTSLDRSKIYLLEWAWHLHESNSELDLVDKFLTDFNEKEALRLIGVALLCTQASPGLRPPMSRVVAMISGDIDVNPVMSRPGYLTDWDFDDTSNFISNVTSTSATSKLEDGHTQSITTSDAGVSHYVPLTDEQAALHDLVGDGR